MFAFNSGHKTKLMFFSKFKNILVLLIFIVIVAVAVVLFWAEKTLKVPSATTESTLIKIENNEGVKAVAESLFNDHLIQNKQLYVFATKLFNKTIEPGYYELPAGASMADIINLIDSGKVKTIKVTIPEGWRLEQIARKLDQEKILSYVSFITEAKSYEGKLFPDTYFMDPRMEAKDVVKMMTDNYQKRIIGLNVTDDNLALASIVEKEAANDTDRGIIAGIYTNRIKAGMKLQSDPTVSYGRDTINIAQLSATDQIAYSFWKAAKTSEFTSVKSSFNTYQISGLPASPICNPGLKSIEAALNPTASSYYYFLYGTDGKLYPSRNSAEHEAAINAHMD